MASIGHIAAGLAAARVCERGPGGSGRTILIFCALSLAADVDVIGLRHGVPYGAPWGHRGATHSIAMAVVLASVAALFRRSRAFWGFFAAAIAVAVSHGVLDAMTDGGHGVALLWPWSTKRFFFGWRPIPVAPIGARLLSLRGLRVVLWEAVAFSPAWVLALWPPKSNGAASPPCGETWRVLAAGLACGLLGLGAYDLFVQSTEASLVAAPCSMAGGVTAAIFISRVRRHRWIVAPLAGVLATAFVCSTSIGLDVAVHDPLRIVVHATSWRDLRMGLALGLYYFGVLWMVMVPWGIVGGYLVGKLVGHRGLAELAAQTSSPTAE